jgi:hypothetical protein
MGANTPTQYFLNLGIVHLVTESNNGKKNTLKKGNEKLAFYGDKFFPVSNFTPL